MQSNPSPHNRGFPEAQSAESPSGTGSIPKTVRLTIAICTRNRAGFLEKAIRSVLPQLASSDELLIVDNASTDGTPAVAARLAKEDSRIRVYREETLGLSAGRNAAHRLGRAAYVLFLDDDAVVRPGWVDAYMGAIERHAGRKVGAIAGGCIPVYEAPPPAWLKPTADQLDLGDKEFTIPLGVRTPGGGNCAYNTAAVQDVGGFCVDLKRAEDTDMYLRLQRENYEIWWLPAAPIYHFISRQRLEFRRMAKAAFNEGRASARMRLGLIDSPVRREFYRAWRVAITVPGALGLFIVALATIPFQRGRIAVRTCHRGVRMLGQGCQMLADLARGKFRYA